MGEGKKNHVIIYVKEDDKYCWENMEGYDNSDATNQTFSIEESSTTSNEEYSSLDTADDDASSSISTSYSSSSEPLYDLSELMSQLPIKRGLSKYYQGKSQSYASLARVKSIEDLAKKEVSYRRRKMKACKSYEGGLDAYKSYTLPKPIIQKKASRGSLMASSFPSRRGSSFSSTCCRPPLIPVQKNEGC